MRIWSHMLKKSLMENLIFCAATWLRVYDFMFQILFIEISL